MRHGQAENNVNRILVGRNLESHLTDYGRKQVIEMANNLRKLPIEKIYASPVMRTIETADIVSKTLGMNYELDERLFEIELGKLVGMNYEEIVKKYGNLFLKFYDKNDNALEDLGVESFSSVKKRVTDFLDHLRIQHANKNVLMVTHLDPIKAVLSILLDLKPESLYSCHIRNASLTILKYEGNVYSLSALNVMGMHRYINE